MRTPRRLLLVCSIFGALLAGCASTNISKRSSYVGVVGRPLATLRLMYLKGGQHLQSVMNGPVIQVQWLHDLAPNSTPPILSIPIPVGTRFVIEKIERRNLFSAGRQILVYGRIQEPQSGREVPFILELTTPLGDQLRTAPWEETLH